MFSRLSSTLRSSGRTLFQQSRARMIKNHNQRRNMGGGRYVCPMFYVYVCSSVFELKNGQRMFVKSNFDVVFSQHTFIICSSFSRYHSFSSHIHTNICKLSNPNTPYYTLPHKNNSHWMEQSQVHTQLGEVFGFVCWMWIFYRAREDLPVVLGWRHPWEHAEDPWAGVDGNVPEEHVEGIEELRADWDTFMEKAKVPGDGDDDEDDEDDEDEDDDEDDEE